MASESQEKEKEKRSRLRRALKDLKTFRTTILMGTAAGAAMTTTYTALALQAHESGFPVHTIGYAGAGVLLGPGIPQGYHSCCSYSSGRRNEMGQDNMIQEQLRDA